MSGYDFTSDWADQFRMNAERLFKRFVDQPVSYLEIGTFEGRSLCWMLDNILTHPECKVVSVDFKYQERAWTNTERHRAERGNNLRMIEGDSKIVVPTLSQKFDIVYIDGDHSAKGCLFDSVMCWEKATGIVLWDDYRQFYGGCKVWDAVKNFLACIPIGEYKVVCDNYQYAIEKLK